MYQTQTLCVTDSGETQIKRCHCQPTMLTERLREDYKVDWKM